MSPRETLKKIGYLAGFILFFFVVLTLRFHFQSKHFFSEGLDELKKGNSREAIVWFDRAIRAHSLLGGPGDGSAEKLREIAEKLEADGDIVQSADVYQTLLSAISAIDTGLSSSRKKEIQKLIDRLEKMRSTIAKAENK